MGSVTLTGYTLSTDFPAGPANHGGSDIFVTKFGPPLPDDQNRTPERCPCASAQPSTDHPVNTRNGNFWTQVSDLAVETPGPVLSWVRTYDAQATGEITSALGFGWQHPFATRLITPTMPGGEPGRIIILSPKGNRLRFADLGNGQYQAFPGVYDTLTRSGNSYIQTLREQQQYSFDATTGLLVGVRDRQGRQIALQYSGTPPRLERIADANDSTRALALSYTPEGRIASVSDGTRTVQYNYDANGDLAVVRDVMNRATTYTYQNHLITEIDNALGQIVKRMTYDTYTPAGKVIHQQLQDGQQLDFQYLAAATVITTTGVDGRRDVQQIDYASDNTMSGIRWNGQAVQASQFDAAFAPGRVSDGNGNTTQTSYTATGLPLQTTNALGQTSQSFYDSNNNLIKTIDPLGVTTLLRYDSFNNVISTTVGITTSSTLRATTLSTYIYNVRYPGDSLLQEQRAPDGVVTHYDYAARGQLIRTTVGYGTPLAQVTSYGYDALGRCERVTIGDGTPLARTDVSHYNPDNTIAETIQNYKDGVFDPARPDEDIVITFGYDQLGRQVWARDALGHVTATHSNAAGQVDWTARNLTPLQLDSQGQPLFQPYSPTQTDANVATLYGYDGLGRTVLVTETGILTGTFDPATLHFSDATTRVTRTEYDALSRPVTVTLNYRPDLPIGVFPDINVQILTDFDGAGNVIWQRDAFGRWTKTEYDALNRPAKTITNYEDGNPLSGARDADLVTATLYDRASRVDRTIDNYVDGVFTATQPITDRVTLYQYDTLNRLSKTIGNYAPGQTDPALNRASALSYDPTTTRLVGQQDTLGRWLSQQYDALGRITASIQNCRTAAGAAAASGCAPFSNATPDRNVPTQTRYDLLGRAFEMVDALGHVTHRDYDGVGRAVATTQNYVASGPASADTNVTTRTTFDALGRPVAQADALNATSRAIFDALGRAIEITARRARHPHGLRRHGPAALDPARGWADHRRAGRWPGSRGHDDHQLPGRSGCARRTGRPGPDQPHDV